MTGAGEERGSTERKRESTGQDPKSTEQGPRSTRRTYLRRATVATMAGLAGCAGVLSGGGTPTATDGPPETTLLPTTEPRDATPEPQTGARTDAPTPTSTPDVLADVSGSYPAYRFDAGRRAFAPETTGPEFDADVAYALDLPGAIYQPVVDGGTLYLAHRRPHPDAPTVEAFDVRSGARQWELDLDGRAGAAPTVAGDRIYLQTGDGAYGITTDGRVDWETGDVATTGFTPPVTEERVYAVGARSLGAYDRAGRRQWGIPLGQRPVAAAAADAETVYLVVPRDRMTTDVLALHADGGGTDWRAQVEVQAGFPPVLADGTVYVASDRRDGGVTALSAGDGDEQWRSERTLDLGPAVTGERVVVARRQHVFALSRTDGSEDWSSDLAEDVVAGPVADSGAVYVGVETDDGGAMHALNPRDGTVSWTVVLDRPVRNLPAVVDGGVLAATRNEGRAGERLYVITGS